MRSLLPLPVLAAAIVALVLALGYGARFLSSSSVGPEMAKPHPRPSVGHHFVMEWPEPRGRGFSEAPAMRDLVANGVLPPVAERLPHNPLVIVPPEQTGPYGGTWKQFADGPGDLAAMTTLFYETLIRWDPLLQEFHPNLAVDWSVEDQGRTFVFELRRGIRWSDGAPFTADDILFWYHHVLLNRDLTPIIPRIFSRGGEVMKVTKTGDYTVRFEFTEPHGLFPQWVANPLMTELVAYPAHYFRTLHREFADPGDLQKLVLSRGFAFWHQLFVAEADWRSIDRPTLAAWKLTRPPPTRLITFERNPYYWKVDPEGNQLPYIDRLVYEFASQETMNLRFLRGDMGVQHRHVSLQNFSLFMENRRQGNYRVNTWISSSGSGVLMLNLNHRDKVMRTLINDRRFRLALSHAINRQEISEAFYSGMGEPLQLSPVSSSPLYREDLARAHTKFDRDKANRLLDEMGLTKRDRNGVRLRPDGKPLRMRIEMFDLVADPGALQLVADYWSAVGVDTEVRQMAHSLFLTRMPARLHDVAIGGNSNVNTPLLDHMYFVPIGLGARHALGYANWFLSDGERGEDPPEEIKRIVQLYQEIENTTDQELQQVLAKKILEINSHHLWLIGLVGNLPGVTLVHDNFRNVPDTAVIFGNAGVTAPECYAIEN